MVILWEMKSVGIGKSYAIQTQLTKSEFMENVVYVKQIDIVINNDYIPLSLPK